MELLDQLAGLNIIQIAAIPLIYSCHHRVGSTIVRKKKIITIKTQYLPQAFMNTCKYWHLCLLKC
jgi:hypothetical protein